MEDNSIMKEIKGKGNGQAVIYISKSDLSKMDCKIGEFLKLEKVSHKNYVKNLGDNQK